MVLRIRTPDKPGDTSRDRDLGPHAGIVQRTPLLAMRRTIDESLVYAARHGHNIGRAWR